jgi:hypothetical protein
MQAEIDALPPVQYEALERVVEQRMKDEQARLQRAVRFEPPIMHGENVLPLSGGWGSNSDEPEEAA